MKQKIRGLKVPQGGFWYKVSQVITGFRKYFQFSKRSKKNAHSQLNMEAILHKREDKYPFGIQSR